MAIPPTLWISHGAPESGGSCVCSENWPCFLVTYVNVNQMVVAL